ncbi:MAG: hypothetical protein U5M53_11230 [Rhodoferax sp.]|nr:hypothetical protein [Rhodoferax sp.]
MPPLAEQSRIVTRVEELMRLCDALEAKARLEATQHEQLVRTLLGTLTTSTTPEELTDNWHRVATHFDLLLDRPEAVDALEQTILQLAVRGLLVPQDPQDEPASELLKKIRAEKDRLILEGKIKRDKPLPPIAEDEKPFELPQGWEWVPIDTMASVGSGTTPSRENPALQWVAQTPWVTSGVERAKPSFDATEQHVDRLEFDSAFVKLPPRPRVDDLSALPKHVDRRCTGARARHAAKWQNADTRSYQTNTCAAIALVEGAAQSQGLSSNLVIGRKADDRNPRSISRWRTT